MLLDEEKELIKKITLQREADEEKVVREGYMKFAPPRPCGYQLLLKLHLEDGDCQNIRDEHGNFTSMIKPELMKEEEQWQTIVGQVVAKGPSCYRGQGEKYKHSGPWCDIGDWMMFNPNDATKLIYRGVLLYCIYDDRVKVQTEKPEYIKRF